MTKRDITLRAWIKTHNKFGKVLLIDWHTEEVMIDGMGYFSFDDVIFEQYTGLKDINGVEIYEGDVAEMYLEEWDVAGNEDPKYYIGVVTFVNGSFVLKTRKYVEDQIFYYYDENSFVVIGNKWENPELLEV